MVIDTENLHLPPKREPSPLCIRVTDVELENSKKAAEFQKQVTNLKIILKH